MHFAAYAYVGESVSDPAKYYRNNVVGTLTLLEAMLAASVFRSDLKEIFLHAWNWHQRHHNP
jgi:UDP-glucose 4-epimerase